MADSAAQSRYERLTAEQMDEQRIQNVAYQYLCRLEEAKRWMEACLGEELPAPTELEEALRNGVVLAKLGHRFTPTAVPLKKIYDPDQQRYQAVGLQFRHTDNINHWRNAMTTLGLPGEEINNMKLELDKYGIQMPAFNKIGGLLANELSVDEAAVHAAVIAINEAVDRGRVRDTAEALRNPNAMLSDLQEALMSVYQEMLRQAKRGKAEQADRRDQGCVDPLEPDELQESLTFANQEAQRARNIFPFAATLYHRELQLLQRQTAQGELQHEELFVAVEMLSAVALINQAMEAGNLQQFSSSLVSPSAGLTDVDHTLLDRYFESLAAVKQQVGKDLLTWNQLQEGINSVNNSAQDEHQQILAVSLINEALIRGDAQKLLSALLLPSSGLDEVLPANACRYLTLLTRARLLKAQVSSDSGAELWLADIQEAVRRANQQSQKALKLCLSVAAVNQAVKENRVKQTLRVLSLPEVALQGLISHCAAEYQQELNALIRDKTRRGDNRSPWVRVQLEDDSFYFFHLSRLEGSWEKPPNFIHNSVFLDQQEIQEVVSGVSGSYSRSVLWRSSEALVTRLQAVSRGFLIRRELEARRRYLHSHTPAAIIIQSRWRRFVQQRAYRRRLQFLYMNWRAVVKVGAVIKIQAFFRANRARHQYRMLGRFIDKGTLKRRFLLVALSVHSDTPPLSVVRQFVHLLDLGDGDIREEAELLRQREEVVRSIRFNRQLEADLDLMDLKIGLLVRNRATLQEVVSHCKKLTKKNKEQLSDMMDMERSKGLKALSRERRERLEAYQHLFYLLQKGLNVSGVIVIYEEHKCSVVSLIVFWLKVDQPQDVVTGNPTVIKMLVNFYRHARGQNVLREVLGPALQDVLLDRTLSIKTDPVDVYKTWINQTETQTGHKSSLPYEVSPQDALSHPEVQRRIDIAIINLKNLTDRVLKAITSNLHKLPYGLRYTAKVLRDALKTKFSEASEDELYKIVGNLVYYRYMNPAVVAPDGFDVVDRSAGSTLQPEQRHILGSIARMLQHAAANKHFHGDGYHVRTLNQYISQTHAKFRKFLLGLCDVPEPEDRFSMDEYSELLIVNKPVIYISVSELLSTHKLLLEHQDVLCPDPSDPLKLLLKDLGSVPTLQELIGESSAADPGSESSLTHSNKIEVSLTLTNKFDIFNDSEDKPDARGLLLSTKQLIIDVIRTQPGDTLSDILRASTSHDQEVCHDWLMQRRAQQDARTPEKMKRNQSLIANGNLSLEEKKRKILRSLRQLEKLEVLKPSQTQNQILQMIAKDIRHQRLRRQRRGAELGKLRETLSSLQAKSSFHSEQVDYYRHYITSCLDNLTDRKAIKAAESKGKKKLPALSYSAARLQEKGVLLEIQDLPAGQFKNVVFDIVPAPEKGTFNVKARFLGVEMEEFLLKYQDLLQLQYEGVAVMKMFDKAKVNVNLLIFLLNKKFFKK
ncbi:hypothetical protein PAMP_002497 [Pampus punctatissimus]